MATTFKDRSRAAIGGVAGLVMLVYLATVSRDPQFGDGMELVAAAAVGGVPHPPGYPLLTMLLMPFSQGQGAYFRAALFCALLVLATALTLARCWAMIAPRRDTATLWDPLLPAAFMGLFALSATAWAAATVVEVYALNAVLLSGIIALMCPPADSPGGGRRVALASFLLGLALCNHLSALCIGPLILVRWIQVLRTNSARSQRAWAWSSPGVFLLGLLPWLYIPIRSAQHPSVNWGGGHTAEGFLWLLRGGDYGQTQLFQLSPGVPFSLDTWLEFALGRAGMLLSVLGGELLGADTRLPAPALMAIGLALLALVLLGAVLLTRRDRVLGAGIALAVFLQIAFVFVYNIPDIEDYFLGIWAAGFLFLCLGIHRMLCLAASRFGYDDAPEKQRRMVFLLAVLILIPLGSNWKVADRSGEVVASSWTNAILAALPENAVLLTHSDYDTYAMWYALHVERRRPDVFLINANFMRYDWYRFMVPREDPLGRTAAPEARDVLGERVTIFEHVDLLRRGAIEPNIQRAPIFTTAHAIVPGPGDPPTVSSVLMRHYRVEIITPLMTPEDYLHMIENYPIPAPPMLEQILPR